MRNRLKKIGLKEQMSNKLKKTLELFEFYDLK